MTKMIWLLSFTVALCFCHQSTEPKNDPRPPTDDEIKAYLKKESAGKETEGEANRQKVLKLQALEDEKNDLVFKIKDKEAKLERDNKRLFRQILTDTAYAWIRQIEHDKSRIKEIDKQIKKMSPVPTVNF